MNNKKSTKRALFSSVLSLVLCMAMLIGTTFAWFTDNASTAVNTIQSGDLEIALEYSEDGGTTWTNAEGQTLNFMAADNRTTILWEPGCTYELPLIRVRNNGNLALKYTLNISGVTGDAKLLEAIEFTANGGTIGEFSGTLLEKNDTSGTILIKGHMKEEAGSDYENLSITGIGITVSATQYTHENDSYNDQYDAGAYYDGQIGTPDELVEALSNKEIKKDTTFVLGADIDMTGVQLAPARIYYGSSVTFIGNGYTISNVEMVTPSPMQNGMENIGMFYLDEKASLTVSDLSIENATINGSSTQYSDAAVIVGYANNQTNVALNNVEIIDSNVKNTAGNAALFVGYAANSTVTMTDCIADGTINGERTDKTGAFFGTIYSGCKVTLTDCVNATENSDYGRKLGDAVVNGESVSATVVTTTEDLVALGGSKINGNYVLAADIDMTGNAMKSMELSGGAIVNFDGNGHTISNLKLGAANIHGMTGTGNEVAGLFDLTAPATTVSLTVSDLTVKNATVSCSGHAAAIVGYNSNGGTVINLNNVDVKGATITAESVAALVGYTTGQLNLNGCDVEELALTGEAGRPEKVGAYVGTANTATCVVTVTNCTNSTDYFDYGRVINDATYR